MIIENLGNLIYKENQFSHKSGPLLFVSVTFLNKVYKNHYKLMFIKILSCSYCSYPRSNGRSTFP